jgi:hypothetical protein
LAALLHFFAPKNRSLLVQVSLLTLKILKLITERKIGQRRELNLHGRETHGILSAINELFLSS